MWTVSRGAANRAIPEEYGHRLCSYGHNESLEDRPVVDMQPVVVCSEAVADGMKLAHATAGSSPQFHL